MNIKDYIPKFRKYSMAFGGGRVEFLLEALDKVKDIPGDFVECGVWRGGNCMLMAQYLKETNQQRKIWMYDTFTGMPIPKEVDVKHSGESAIDKWHEGWCKASLKEVDNNMKLVGYNNYICIEGDVLETIPNNIPKEIALLRLDTDWYDSTKHELTHLYSLLSPGGILIVDDYHCWQGSRKACDEYFEDENFIRINQSSAIWRKK